MRFRPQTFQIASQNSFSGPACAGRASRHRLQPAPDESAIQRRSGEPSARKGGTP